MTKTRIALIAASVPVAIVIIIGAVYGIDRWTNAEEIQGPVSVLDVELGGLGEDDARERLARTVQDAL